MKPSDRLLRDAYEAGARIKDVAAAAGVSYDVARGWLLAAGVGMRRGGRMVYGCETVTDEQGDVYAVARLDPAVVPEVRAALAAVEAVRRGGQDVAS